MLKRIIKKACFLAGIDLTRNMAYDRYAAKIMRGLLRHDSNCIDVGSHNGEFLGRILRCAPGGRHYAFEPIPEYYETLVRLYGDRATVLPYALSDKDGETIFHFVRNAPAYSGLKKRSYATSTPDICEIRVQTRALDNVIPPGTCIHFMKIDVEGAEYDVLKGARALIKECRPVIVFEFGLGASEYYHTSPEDVYKLLSEECGLCISLLKDFPEKNNALSFEAFEKHYQDKTEYYFIAHP